MRSFLITRHEDIKAVLSDHERFSNERPVGFAGRLRNDRPKKKQPPTARATCSASTHPTIRGCAAC